jgi:hypothetical protein
MASGAAPSSRDKVREHRTRMRAKGMKLVQLWVPDVRSAAFEAEARRQARRVAECPHEAADQGFIDSISEF